MARDVDPPRDVEEAGIGGPGGDIRIKHVHVSRKVFNGLSGPGGDPRDVVRLTVRVLEQRPPELDGVVVMKVKGSLEEYAGSVRAVVDEALSGVKVSGEMKRVDKRTFLIEISTEAGRGAEVADIADAAVHQQQARIVEPR